MRSPASFVLGLLPLIASVHGSIQINDRLFCYGVNVAVTDFHEQKPASSFCASYLHLSTTCTDVTVTSTKSLTTTATISSTKTLTSTISATDSVTTSVTSQVTNTATTSATVLTTTVVATSTSFTSTSTSSVTATTTVTATSASTSTVTSQLTQCARPTQLARKKRELGKKGASPKPDCLSKYNDGPAISRACSCLSIPHPTTTRTSTVSVSRTATVTSFATVTQYATVTAVFTSTASSTVLQTVSTTQTALSTSTLQSTAVVSLVSTTTTTTTATVTSSTAATQTVTRYSSFALLSSLSTNYGSIQNSVGGSGSGIYFSQSQLSSAATFDFQGNRLLYNSQYLNSYQTPASGSYFPVVNRPYEALGFNTFCSLDTSNPSAGCKVTCNCDGAGVFPAASGNNVDNYGGTWGLQGTQASNNKFNIYAVGQT